MSDSTLVRVNGHSGTRESHEVRTQSGSSFRDANADHQLSLLVLQPTPFCNLDCSYCYLPHRSVTKRMPDTVLRRAIEAVVASGLVRDRLNIVWHAGEPMALPVSYYRNAFRIARQAAGSIDVGHAMQTNGTLIDDEWCRFINEENIRIGVSLDGPAWLHDAHRVSRRGSGSHARTMRGVHTLEKHGIAFHVIAVVTAQAVRAPEAIFDFFVDAGIGQVGLNFEEIEASNTTSSLSAGSKTECRTFLDRLFELNASRGFPLAIREFDRARQALLTPAIPGARRLPDQQSLPLAIISIDCDGFISTFSPEFLGARSDELGELTFGNVMTDDFVDVLENEIFLRLWRDIATGIDLCARTCSYFAFCGGGAPANKLFENGTCASTETMYCRHAIQSPIDVVLSRLESAATASRGESHV